MGVVGTGSEKTPLHIEMSDLEHMLFESHNKILILAEKGITFEAKKEVSIVSPLNIHAVRTDKAKEFQPLIAPFGTLSNIPGAVNTEDTEEIEENIEDPTDIGRDTYLIMHNRFDMAIVQNLATQI